MSNILINPIVSEKSNFHSESQNKYVFKVQKKSNKISIKKAVESYYNVKVKDVNTFIVAGKSKSRYTKSGFLVGKSSSYKKAIVTIEKDEKIDLYADI